MKLDYRHDKRPLFANATLWGVDENCPLETPVQLNRAACSVSYALGQAAKSIGESAIADAIYMQEREWDGTTTIVALLAVAAFSTWINDPVVSLYTQHDYVSARMLYTAYMLSQYSIMAVQFAPASARYLITTSADIQAIYRDISLWQESSANRFIRGARTRLQEAAAALPTGTRLEAALADTMWHDAAVMLKAGAR